MTVAVPVESGVPSLLACTISRDIQNFDLLIEDMEANLGESWGDLSFGEAIEYFSDPDADGIEFIAIAVDEEDEADLTLVTDIISAAKAKDIKVILIADEVSPIALHHLLRQGADEFIPYPLPQDELAGAIERVRTPEPEPVQAPPPQAAAPVAKASGPHRNGVLLGVHGLAGGTGASTLAVNLAWELATIEKEGAPRVALLDLDLQFGSVATYLDLQRHEAVYELLSDTDAMDADAFMQAMQKFEDTLHVLTSPSEVLPLDIIAPQDIDRVLEMAVSQFDYVVVDMPGTLVQWTETVLSRAHVYFSTLELEMRSAENALRMKRALQSEELPFEKLRYILNRAPKFSDLSGRSRVKRMSETLGIALDVQLPDGGKVVMEGADQGQPLGLSAPKNPLRKEIRKLAVSVHELNSADIAAE